MYQNKKIYEKIGTHWAHVASQEKRQHMVFIKQNETSKCNIIYISYNAYNTITRSEIQWL